MDQPTTLSAAKQALLAQRLKRAAGSPAQAPGIPRRTGAGPAPLSYAQRQMWAIDQMTQGNPAYNLPIGYRLRGALDVPALERAFNGIVGRHESLRTTFALEGGEPVQIVHPALSVPIRVTDLAGLPEDEREARARSLATQAALAPFDLACLPLVAVSLFRLAEAEHVLVINLHHIIADGISTTLIMKELDALYRAETGSEAARLPALAVQYPDYAAWQHQALADGSAYAGQLGFWRERLGGTLPVLELPCDKPRPARQSFAGSNVFFELSAADAEALKAVGAGEGCTFFMTVLAAFQALLHRYTGAEDLVVGAPLAARTAAEIEPLIGNFLNIVPLRCDVSGDPGFLELLRRSRATTLDAMSNSAVPFEALVKHLKVERSPDRNPLFQVLLQVLPAAAPRLGALEVGGFHFDLGIAQVDLSLHLYEEDGGYRGRIEYCTDLFEAATAERLASAFAELLRAVVRDPAQKLSQIPLLPAAEKARLLEEWNATAADYPKDAVAHGLVEAQATRAPGRTAIVSGAGTRTYVELNTRAARIAQALRARGIGRGSRVGLCVERGPDMVAALLGILKAGAAYVPLDPSFPQERLRFMCEDAQLALLVSTGALAAPFGLPRERQLLLDADAGAIAQAPDAPLPADERAARPGDPAYVIYTSGSTGKPKGVVVPHRAVVNFLAAMAREPGLGPDDVLVAVTTLSFDIAVLELYLPLSLGATVALASREEATDGRILGALLQKHRATVMQATPVTWRLLLEAGWTPPPGFKALVGGEALPRDLADQLIARGAELWNLYGPTETTVWSTCARIASTAGGIPIGKPIANTVVRVLDARLNLCPVGVPGELYIGGDGVTLGYWNRPELTAERFVRDPFDAQGRTLYRTGDRARWRHDGTLEHLGRLDDQVKLRGLRIELGEIEAALASHPGVREAAVHLWTVKPGDLRIVACCVPAPGVMLAPISLRKHVRGRLPDYMVPQYFLPVEAIARTPNGKVDRRRLATPVVAEARAESHESPAGPVESLIAEIWTKMIQPARPVGRADKFFEIGGYSLLGLSALRQMEDRLGARLDFQVLYRESLADIAARFGNPPAAGREGHMAA